MSSASESMISAPKLYTPNMAMVAALLGGPFAGGGVIFANYKALGNPAMANKTILWSLVGFAILITLGFLLPDSSSRSFGPGLSGAVAVLCRQHIKQYQWQSQSVKVSWWRALLIGVAGIIVSLILLSAVAIVST